MVTPDRKQILSETPQISTDHRGFTSFTDISPCKAQPLNIPVQKFDLLPAMKEPAYVHFIEIKKQEDVKKEVSELSVENKSDEELILNIARTPTEEASKLK